MEYAATWNLKISTLKIWNPRHRPALIYHQGLEIPQECSESFVSPSFLAKKKVKYTQMISIYVKMPSRGGICPCRHCRRQFKIFASGVHFSIFTHFLCFFSLKLLKLGEIDGVKFLAWKSGGVKFWTNSMSDAKRGQKTSKKMTKIDGMFPTREICKSEICKSWLWKS